MYSRVDWKICEKTVKNNSEIIREKFKDLAVSQDLKKLRGCIKLTEEELQDDRTQYI